MSAAWTLVPNPGYDGEPRVLEAVCHDGTPFITLACPKCGSPLHMHESQLSGLPSYVTISAGCPECRKRTDIGAAFLLDAFQQMRDDGWIA